MFRNVSIKRKQTLIIMVTSSVALLLACAAFVSYEMISFRQAMVRDLSIQARMIAGLSTAALEFDDPATAREMLKELRDEKHIVAACIYKKEKLFAQYVRLDMLSAFTPYAARADSYEFKDDHLILFRRVLLKGEPIGCVFIMSDLKELSSRLRQYGGIVSVFWLASSFVAFLLSTKLQRVISQPILHLAATARIVSSQKDYTVRALKHGQDELGQLIDGFNEMLGQIQQRDAALQKTHDELEERVAERTSELQQEVTDRKRAEEALQQQLTRISLLNSITRAIAARQDLESIVHVVLRQLTDHLTIEFGRVYLFDPQTQTISVATHRGKSYPLLSELASLANQPMPLEQTGLQSCKAGETFCVADAVTGETTIERKLAKGGLRSAVAVPLMVEDALFGILLTARSGPNAFSSGECEFLRVLGEQVALAAHQARLHTQLQSAYDELRQTQQAVMQEERLRALGQMASGIAHDINNALSPIVAYADLLIRTERGLGAKSLRHLESIRTASDDISHIVSRMREFYRKRNEQDPIARVNLNKLAEQVIDLTRPRWRDISQARGVVVEMKTDFEPNLTEIVGNESELREAVTNLILNSVDALPSGGTVTLRTRSRQWGQPADSQRHPAEVLLEVCDTGQGMDEETRKRCLEPFFSTKGKRGTGLGLAMVYGVMERHEASIEIESQVGKGTTMRLVFPMRQLPDAAGATLQGGLPSLPPLRLLYIDDEPLLRELLREVLTTDGHYVEVADSGQAGLEAFRAARDGSKPFDVVITDLGMPYLDGRQVATTLKRESPTVPVIMLTGWGTLMKADGDLPAQVDGIVSKPPKITELYEVLARVMAKPPGAKESCAAA